MSDHSLNRRGLLRGMALGAVGLSVADVLRAEAATGSGELTVALPNNPATFDPLNQANHDAMAVGQLIFENLVDVDEKGNLVPTLAVALPTASPDGLTWTFDLRADVHFQNGKKFAAEDVKYSFDWVLDPANKALRRPIWEPIKNVVVESDTRVRFELSRPYASWLYYMTKYMGIFPKNSRAEHPDGYFRSTPIGVGTGPGIFVEARSNDYVRLKRNDKYWRKDLPKWEQLTFRIIPEDAARVAYLKTNQVQIIGAIPPRDFETLRSSPGLAGDRQLALGSKCFIATNNLKAPFDDVRFRKAVSCAIDRKAVADLFSGFLEPSASLIPSKAWWYDAAASAAVDYNPAEAKKHLAASKYASGASFEMLMPSEAYLIDVKDAGQLIQAQLAELGITAHLRVLETSQLIREMLNGNQVAALAVFVAPPDPLFQVRSSFSPGQTTFKATNYRSEALLKAIDDADKAVTPAELKPAMSRIQAILAEDCPNVFIGAVYASNVWRAGVKGFTTDAGLTMRLKNATPA